MNHSEIAELMKALAPVVGDFVSKAIAPLRERNNELSVQIETLKSQLESFPSRDADLDKVFEFVTQSVNEAVAKIPAPTPGKDADPALVTELVNKAVALLPPAQQGPPGNDGRSVTMLEVGSWINDEINKAVDSLTNIVHKRVEDAISAIPTPEKGEPGEPGKSVTIEEILPLIDDKFEKAVSNIFIPQPEKGDKGEKGDPGNNVTIEEIIPLLDYIVKDFTLAFRDDVNKGIQERLNELDRAIENMPAPEKGDKGDPGEPGKSVTIEDIIPLIDDITKTANDKIEAAIAAIPPPEPGPAGKDADPVEIAKLLIPEVERAVSMLPPAKDGIGLAGALIDRDGHLVVTLTDGKAHKLGQVVGKDVDMDLVLERVSSEIAKIPKPKDGVDGFGFEHLDLIEIDGKYALSFRRGDEFKNFPLPIPVYHDVWKEQEYKKGACVTWSGSMWLARRDTNAKPETNDDWKLVIKRGRDGQSVYDIARKNGFKGTEKDWLESLRPKAIKPVKLDPDKL